MADSTKRLRVELSGDSSKFEKSFKGAKDSVSSLGKEFGSLQKSLSVGFGALAGAATAVGAGLAAVGGALAFATKQAIDYASSMGDLADRTGLTVEWLQAAKYAAEQSGTSLERVTDSATKLQKALGDGTAETQRAVKALGLSFEDLRRAAPDEQMNRVLAALSKMEDPTARTTAAMRLLGRSGTELIPLAADFDALRARAEELGIVLSENSIRATKAFGDGIAELESVFGGLMNNLGLTITTSAGVHEALKILTQALGDLSRWVAANREEIRAFVTEGLASMLRGFTSVLQGVGLLSEGIYQIRTGLLELGGVFAKAAAGAEFLGAVMSRPWDAKKALDEYRGQISAINSLVDAQVKAAQGQRDAVTSALVSGALTAAKMTDALERLGTAEVEAGKSGTAGAAGITDLTDAAEKAAAASLKLDQEYNKALASIVSVKGDDNFLASLDRQLEEMLPKLDRLGPTVGEVRRSFEELQEAAAFIGGAQGLAGLDDTQLKTFISEMERLGDTSKLTSEQWGVLGDAYTEAMQRGIIETEKAEVATIDWRDSLAQIADLVQALPGMLGQVGQAFASITAGISGIGSAIDQWQKAGKGFEGLLAKLGAVGQAASAAIGIVKGLGNAIGWATGANKRKEVNKLRDEFIASQGGLEALKKKAAEAGVSLDRLFAARDSKKGVQAAIDDITKRLGLWDEAQGALNDAIERYGFELDELGPVMQRQKLDEQAAQLLQDFKLLTASGIDVGTVIGKMGPSLAEFVNQSLAAGQAIPIAMKPMVDQLIASGQLLDENGVAFESAEAAGITFSETLTEGLSRAVDAIEQLVAALTGVPPVRIPVSYDVQGGPPGVNIPVPNIPTDGLPSFAGGGIGDFGRGSLAVLHGREAIIPLDRAGQNLGVGDTFNVDLKIDENPLQTFEGVRRQRDFTLRVARRDLTRSLAAAVAAGRA